ncbi:MAG: hypothetical protein OEN56_03215 [Gemmatimonadota bacterium]|nr:hypothetical protein [Gemmatimonadota bacterium]
MSFLARLFGSRSDAKATKDLDARLARLEAEAERAAPGYVGSAYNRAGDLALREGRPEQAVDYYGQAIDAFLEDAQREAARGVANKIIRVRPAAVRTLCTLTWLDLAARHQATALLHLRDYVEGAREAGERARAATQIFEMAKLSHSSEFTGAVADALDGLDYPNRAREVRGWAADETGDEEAEAERHDHSDACLRAAIRSNQSGGILLVDDESQGKSDDGREVDDRDSGESEPKNESDPDENRAREDEPEESERVVASGDDDRGSGGREMGSHGRKKQSKKKQSKKKQKKK